MPVGALETDTKWWTKHSPVSVERVSRHIGFIFFSTLIERHSVEQGRVQRRLKKRRADCSVHEN